VSRSLNRTFAKRACWEAADMSDPYPKSTARVAGHPIHPMLVPIPIAGFTGALLTDIAYACTADTQWAVFSSWLLVAGLVGAALAAVAGLIDFLSERRIRRLRPAWIHAVGNVAAVLLELLNVFVHSRDAWTSVVPWGLALSIVTVLILLVTGWNGWEMVYRHGVAVRPRRADGEARL
jgi:uncharacterized membrane protein